MDLLDLTKTHYTSIAHNDKYAPKPFLLATLILSILDILPPAKIDLLRRNEQIRLTPSRAFLMNKGKCRRLGKARVNINGRLS